MHLFSKNCCWKLDCALNVRNRIRWGSAAYWVKLNIKSTQFTRSRAMSQLSSLAAANQVLATRKNLFLNSVFQKGVLCCVLCCMWENMVCWRVMTIWQSDKWGHWWDRLFRFLAVALLKLPYRPLIYFTDWIITTLHTVKIFLKIWEN